MDCSGDRDLLSFITLFSLYFFLFIEKILIYFSIYILIYFSYNQHFYFRDMIILWWFDYLV